jgi:stage III sporulation protein AH
MVTRKHRLLTLGAAVALVAVTVVLAWLSRTDSLRYFFSWDPRPAGTGEVGPGGESEPGSPAAGTKPGTPAAPSTPPGSAPLAGIDFFLDFRLERERTRGQQLEYLRELINNAKADESARKQAAIQWLELTRQVGKELELEGLIKAKGWPDCVVFVQDKACTVVVKAEKLSQAEVARVGDIVIRGTGLGPQAINIVARPS